jgi:hypothetical protein
VANTTKNDLTWHQVTGHTGKKLRQQMRKNAKKAALAPTIPVQKPTTSIHTRSPSSANLHVVNSVVDDPTIPVLEFCADGTFVLHSATDVMARANKAVHPDTGKLAEYQQLRTSSEGHLWEHSCALEMGRLAQGLPPEQPEGRDTFRFIPKSKVPKGAKVTYLRIVSTYRPQKDLKHRVRFTCGGNLLDYQGKTSTRTADLTTFKICVNKVLSTKNARACCFDLSDFYLCHRLEYSEFMRIHRSIIPQRIIDAYDLEELFDEQGYVYVEIVGGMYGLKQAGIIANKELVKHLDTSDYYECRHTPGLFRHRTRDIFFSLVVDDFFVGYVGEANALHLRDCLAKRYKVSCDWNASLFCGITLTWDYVKRICDLSMPGYIAKALQRFEHAVTKRRTDSPSPWTPPIYGAKSQLATPVDTLPLLSDKERKRIQEVVGTLLYYARAVDVTMLHALSTLASAQSTGTHATMDSLVHLLNYAASHPDAVLRYRASDMQLHVHADGSYLSEPKARSREAEFFFLGDKLKDPDKAPPPDVPASAPNGALLVNTKVLKEVVSAAAEVEMAALFNAGKNAEPIRTTLDELDHPQGKTPMQTDNSTAKGIANDEVSQKRSKAMDMRYYWIQDRTTQGHFLIYWAKGLGNLADYFTKHHPASHHRAMRPVYVHVPDHPSVLRGCVDPSVPSIHDSKGDDDVTLSDDPGYVPDT